MSKQLNRGCLDARLFPEVRGVRKNNTFGFVKSSSVLLAEISLTKSWQITWMNKARGMKKCWCNAPATLFCTTLATRHCAIREPRGASTSFVRDISHDHFAISDSCDTCSLISKWTSRTMISYRPERKCVMLPGHKTLEKGTLFPILVLPDRGWVDLSWWSNNRTIRSYSPTVASQGQWGKRSKGLKHDHSAL